MAERRPTILQIIPTLDTGGAELSTVEIAAAIVAGGGRAMVATQGGRLAARIIEAGGEIVPFRAASKNPVVMMANARGLAHVIRTEQVDLVHARSRAPAWSALSAARATKRPFVTTYHGAYGEKNALKRAYNSVMARGDVVIANSSYTGHLIQARYGTPDDKIRIIHRGVDPASFNPATVAPERLARLASAWGIETGQRVILHAARLTKWKGQLTVIEAAALLAKAGSLTGVVAVFAGDDQGRTGYTEELKYKIAAAGLERHIRLVGHVDDIQAAFGLASVSLIASTEPEAFGRTAIEAQMMGCPVIATKIGAPPETVLAPPAVAPDAQTGWLIAPGHANELALAIAAALGLSAGERQGMAHRSRAHVAARFSLDAMKQATLRVYDELLDSHLANDTPAPILHG